NIWIAAAEGNEASVVEFLSRDPSAVNALDENGYTPLHAAASYSHASLLKKLVLEHGGNVNLQDLEGDTPLFVAETVQIAKVLVEELNADPNHRNSSGLTATDVIEEDGDFPLVAAYLRSVENREQQTSRPYTATANPISLPPNVSVNLTAEEGNDDLSPVDESFRQRIEQLASRGDFASEESQNELRRLVTEAV
ncbi:ankyrin repeat-containing domain protein, partial [Kalaharituber pfeilii]